MSYSFASKSFWTDHFSVQKASARAWRRLTRAWPGYFHNTNDRGGYFLPPPPRTQELLVRITKFKRRSIDLEILSKET